jgi:PAS domain S-box-containing protein
MMVKIADIIQGNRSQEQSESILSIPPDTPVGEVLRKMQETGCDSIAVEDLGCEEPAILSREDVLHGLLMELDRTQTKLTDLQQQIEGSIADRIDMVQEGARTLAEWEKDKLQVAIENMSEGLIIFGTGGEIEKANPSAKRLVGLEGDGSLQDLAAVIDGLGFRELVCRHDDTDEGSRGEFKVRSRSGRILKIRWTEMIDRWNHFLGNVVTIRDVTEEDASDRAKTEFIASISHELRTPLTSIQNSVSNILAGVTGKISRKTREYLHAMKSDCHRFADLINDMLDMAKLEAGSMPINRRVVNIVSVAGDTIREFSRQAAECGIQLTCSVDSHISPVYADPQRVGQVLWKLVSNALRFTPRGGKVSVKMYDSGENVITLVQDDGIGIEAELQKQIFSKFYQIRRQAGPGSNGSGLGLAICSGIVAVHGGAIWVESEKGNGSKFFFSLPKSDPFIVMYKHIHAMIDSARQSAGDFALYIVGFDIPHEHRQELRPAAGAIINELLTESDHLLPGKRDLVIQTEDFEVVFVIDGPDKKRWQNIQKEIQKIVVDRVRKRFNRAPILPMFGMAVYPRQATKARDLEKAARQQMTEMA